MVQAHPALLGRYPELLRTTWPGSRCRHEGFLEEGEREEKKKKEENEEGEQDRAMPLTLPLHWPALAHAHVLFVGGSHVTTPSKCT